MCGIVATLNEGHEHILRAMVEAVSHRGPDSLEVWTNGMHGAAGSRLSIFGPSEGPMIYHHPGTSITVLLNGEIYNYNQLWEELQEQGKGPLTGLESELIATLYQQWGHSFARKLQGMFAIAILNGSRLVLARDRFGIKPLNYTIHGGMALVCSEIKGLLKHPAVRPVFDREALEETRVFGYVCSPERTFFQGVHQVPPGVVLEIDAGHTEITDRYDTLPKAVDEPQFDASHYDQSVQDLKKRVIEAVDKLARHGHMSKGLFLSGGLDSTIIALVASRYLNYPLFTFTLSDRDDSPDLLAARRVAKALATEHRELRVSLQDYWRALPRYVAHYESLMAGGVYHVQGGIAFHMLAEEVARHVRVAFTGEGADELFGGYYWIYTHPLGFSDRIRKSLSAVPGNESLRNLVDSLFPQPEDENTYRLNLFDFLLRGGLANYHLQSVDRSGGAYGIEIRPPYLEDALAQIAMLMPVGYKVPHKAYTKRILREAFRGDFVALGIEDLLTRQKVGMPSALNLLNREAEDKVISTISDEEVARRPYGALVGSKFGLLLYDTFEQIFLGSWNPDKEDPPADSLLAQIWPDSLS